MNTTTYTEQHSSRLLFRKFLILFIIIFISNLTIFDSDSQAKVLFKIGPQNYWHHFEGSKRPKSKWSHSEFDDSNWKATRPIDRIDNQSAMNTYEYMRYKFLIDNPRKIKKLVLTVVTNVAFATYLNGIEAIRSDAGVITIDKANPKKLKPELIDLSGFIGELLPGPNVIAIQYKGNSASTEKQVFYATLEAFDAE